MRAALTTLSLAGVALALLWPSLLDGALLPAVFPGSDLLLSHWPNAHLLKETAAETGRLPLWNPHYGGGRPVPADPLAALFYPPTHLVHLLGLRSHFLLLMIGHLLLAGLGTLLLARRGFGLGWLPSLVAALAFMASPRLVSHLGAGHVTLIQAVAWYPWVALLCWQAARDPRPWGLFLALGLAMLLLAGHPQMAYYAGLMLASIAAWTLVGEWRRRGPGKVARGVAGLVVAVLLATLLASAHLIPALELTAHSTRQQPYTITDQVPLEPFLKALVGLRVPWEQREGGVPHEVMFEPGLSVMALALVGATALGRLGMLLMVGIALVGGLAMGLASPVFHLALAVIPGYESWFRAVARVWFVATLAIALLAGVGARVLVERASRSGRRWAPAVAGLACAIAVSANLLLINQGLTRPDEVAAAVTPTPLEKAAVAAAEGGRIYGVERNLTQAGAIALGAHLADGQDPLLLEPYASFMQRAGGYSADGYQLTIPAGEGQPDAELLGWFDTTVVVARRPLDDVRLEAWAREMETTVYRNPMAKGRSYLVREGDEGDPPTIDSLVPLVGAVGVVASGPERWLFAVDSAFSGWLVIAQPAYPGWEAELDGRPVEVRMIDGVLPAVAMPAGSHTVSYSYRPRTLVWGAAASAGGVVLAVVWGLLLVRRKLSPLVFRPGGRAQHGGRARLPSVGETRR